MTTKCIERSFKCDSLCGYVILRGGSCKLHSPWVGPYKIVKCLADTVYRTQDTHRSRKRIVVHFDRLNHVIQISEYTQSDYTPVSSEDVNTETGKSLPPGTNLQHTECSDDWDDRQEQEGTVSQHPPDSLSNTQVSATYREKDAGKII